MMATLRTEKEDTIATMMRRKTGRRRSTRTYTMPLLKKMRPT
jgi:hypothetical protein